MLVDNLQGGFIDYIEIAPGTTVRELFEDRMEDDRPEDFIIRVNREAASADQALSEGDKISFTPLNIEGA